MVTNVATTDVRRGCAVDRAASLEQQNGVARALRDGDDGTRPPARLTLEIVALGPARTDHRDLRRTVDESLGGRQGPAGEAGRAPSQLGHARHPQA